MSDASLDPSADAETLRTERDQLRDEVERLRQRGHRRGRVRRVAVVVLVVLACVSLTAAVPATWARRNFLDTGRFSDKVAPLVDEPAVQDALTARLTDQLMRLIDPRALFEEALPERGQLLAVPLANAVEGFVNDRVETFVASDRFAELWGAAVTFAHETAVRVLRGESEVVTTGDGEVTLNLLPIIDAVLLQITSASPEILGREVDIPDVSVEDVPAEAIAALESRLDVDLPEDFGQITVYDDGKLAAAQDGIELFDRLVFVLVVLSVVFAALALWLSGRRRRTLLQLAGGVVIGMVLIRRVVFRFQDDLVALPPTPEGEAAAAVVVDAFLAPLMTFAAWAIVVAGLTIVVALLTGGYAWAVGLRRRTADTVRQLVSTTGERARDEATVAWIRQHRDGLLAGTAVVGLVILWAVDLSWLALALVVVILGAVAGAVYRIAAPDEAGPNLPAPP